MDDGLVFQPSSAKNGLRVEIRNAQGILVPFECITEFGPRQHVALPTGEALEVRDRLENCFLLSRLNPGEYSIRGILSPRGDDCTPTKDAKCFVGTVFSPTVSVEIVRPAKAIDRTGTTAPEEPPE